MDKITTVLAIALQAVIAVLLVIVMSHLFPADQFVKYSFGVGTAQIFSNLAYEWLRIATMRHYPGPPSETLERLGAVRKLLALSTFALVACFGIATGIGIYGGSFSGLDICAVAFLAVIQGVTDLQFTLLRFKGRLTAAGLLQIMRVVMMAGLAFSFAFAGADVGQTIFGLALGQAATSIVAMAAMPEQISQLPERRRWKYFKVLTFQGVPAALASQSHLVLTYLLRAFGVFALGSTTQNAAGFSLAIDLLQRPFALVGTFLLTVYMPKLVQAYEIYDAKLFRKEIQNQYNLLFSTTIFGTILIFVYSGRVAANFVDLPNRDGFLLYAPPLATYFFALFHLQLTLSIVPQISKKTYLSLIVGLIHLVAGLALLAACHFSNLEMTFTIWLMCWLTIAMSVLFWSRLSTSIFPDLGKTSVATAYGLCIFVFDKIAVSAGINILYFVPPAVVMSFYGYDLLKMLRR